MEQKIHIIFHILSYFIYLYILFEIKVNMYKMA